MSQRACPFASKSVTEHLVRGVSAAGLIALTVYLAYTPSAAATAGAIASGVGAVVLMRGCPTCWLTGLFATIAMRSRQRAVAMSQAKQAVIAPSVTS